MMTNDLSELQTDMKQSQEKQNELLEFTAKLTEKNTQLQSENTTLKERLHQIETDLAESNQVLKESNESLSIEARGLTVDLAEKASLLSRLEKELAELKRTNEELTGKLSDERNELSTLKKKHAANLKDLTRQIQSLEKKVIAATVVNTPSTGDVGVTGPGKTTTISRDNSIGSLSNDKELSLCEQTTSGLNNVHETEDCHSVESAPMSLSMNSTFATGPSRFQHEVLCDGIGMPNTAVDDVYVFDVDKQKLIEKIVRLQRRLAKSNEKIDFMQDHVNQLTEDLKRKTR